MKRIAVGSSPLAKRFYAGAYAELLAKTHDANRTIAEHDIAFVVGALTFVDRVDEAQAVFDAWHARHEEPHTHDASTTPHARDASTTRHARHEEPHTRDESTTPHIHDASTTPHARDTSTTRHTRTSDAQRARDASNRDVLIASQRRGASDAQRAHDASNTRRTLTACRFFLGLAAARAGYFERATLLLVRENLRARHAPDPWVRALVYQGLACQFYFTGHYRSAAAHALRALTAAHEAKFLYAAMLGTDMRGHALVQIGQLQRGIAMLEQAGTQAQRLALVNNAFAVETSIATYITKFDPRPESLARVEELLGRRAHDSYSRRALLVEAAVQRALRGRGRDALDALQAADRDALRGDTRRGKLQSLCARLWVTRWQRGVPACAELVEQARSLVEEPDAAFRAQVLLFEVLVARAVGDSARELRGTGELRALWRATHHFAAKAALGQLDVLGESTAFDEDGVTPLLKSVTAHDASALPWIVAQGLHGTIPELLGLAPGRRIIFVPAHDMLLLEDQGDIAVRHRPPRWCPALLRLLASGDATKERIVAGMWGLRAYHPELHDPPVRTTIHRLRSFITPYKDWIEASEGGYRTTVPIHVVGTAPEPIRAEAPLWEEGLVPSLEPAPAARDEPETIGVKQAVVRRLAQLETATVPQLAKTLELSASTVLRALRELVEDRQVERLGFARATRYRVTS